VSVHERLIYVGLGSNLGDRYGNIAQGIQGLRRIANLEALSSLYETEPVGVAGPTFLNAVAQLRTTLTDEELLERFKDLERRLGRGLAAQTDARPIDLDLLEIEKIGSQPYYLVAIAELTPERIDPISGRPFGDLANAVSDIRVKRRERALRFQSDRQSGAPEVALAIDKVGVDRIQRSLSLNIDGKEQDVLARFTLTADLARHRAGVHMSRFSEHLESATPDVFARETKRERLDLLLGAISKDIVQAQTAEQADVQLEAQFTLERWTPVSGRPGEETYTLIAHARANRQGVRCAIGVEVEGMTACPCAQLMMREQGVRDLEAAGFSAEDAARALDALPAATHNQRGRGRLLIGLPPGFEQAVRLEDLVELVEQSMSSETYELLKRPDEFFVVNKAHRNPKFVEDVVRGILMRAIDLYGDFPDTTFLEASQVNDESIHKHDAVAYAYGTMGELRAELRGNQPPTRRTTRSQWFDSER
jgi:GTP cyclohydrolase-4